MKDKEVLQKAIEIAIENGMSPKVVDRGTFFRIYWVQKGRGGQKVTDVEYSMEDCYGLIFSHDFAKAFFPKDDRHPVMKRSELPQYNHEWEKHLMLMVLESNPIDYLRKFIEE